MSSRKTPDPSPGPEATAAPAACGQKFISCLQSTGRIGKSTFAEALIHWLSFAGVAWRGVDADAEHRTLSSRHKDILFFDALKDSDQFAFLIKNIPADAPVLLADFPAQATGFLLENWSRFRVDEVLAARGSRMVNVIFAADDQTAILSAAQVFRRFGTAHSDYVIVRNPARARSAEFEKTKLYASLRDAGAPEISLPALTADSLSAVQALSKARGRHVSLSEAGDSPEMNLLNRFELQHFLNVAMTRMEDAGAVLLPSLDVIQRKVFRGDAPAAGGAAATQTELDPFDL